MAKGDVLRLPVTFRVGGWKRSVLVPMARLHPKVRWTESGQACDLEVQLAWWTVPMCWALRGLACLRLCYVRPDALG